ncbi:hypothetical protein [Mitsuokella sp. WILCCON 0060]|uniref:hypothetical protein n=1 Tax=unclassified Mitsuokella TaxID=2637239 RepID=UPI003F0CA1B4
MKDRNQKQRRHIRAARAWLGEAEHSLAENHRVRGELKVMLAKAELARVEGTPGHRFLKKWTMRLLPAAMAVLIAGGGWLFWQARTPSLSSSYPPASAVQETPQEPTPQETTAAMPEAAASHDAPLAPSPAGRAEPSVPAAVQTDPVQVKTEKTAAPAQQPVAEQSAAPAAKTPKVPDDGMQKLMQTAGKTLRN